MDPMMRDEKDAAFDQNSPERGSDEEAEIFDQNKTFLQKITPVFASGAGLFSDGYVNGVS